MLTHNRRSPCLSQFGDQTSVSSNHTQSPTTAIAGDTVPSFMPAVNTCIRTNFIVDFAWWRHQISSALRVLCEGNPPSQVDSPHKGRWRGTIMFPLMCAWINGWTNNGDAGDLRCHRAHYDVTVMEGAAAIVGGHIWLAGESIVFSGTSA